MKSRAERFGITFNANATPTRTTPSQAQAPSPVTPSASETTTPASTKTKAGAIDPQPLGLSEDVLAKRAAKFGVPEKKAEAVKEAPASATPTKKAEVEVTPYVSLCTWVFGRAHPFAYLGRWRSASPSRKKRSGSARKSLGRVCQRRQTDLPQ